MSDIRDAAEMPGLDQRTTGLHSVSEGKAVLVRGKPYCRDHGAMNMVRADGLWRCQHAVAGKPTYIDARSINLCDAAAYTHD